MSETAVPEIQVLVSLRLRADNICRVGLRLPDSHTSMVETVFAHPVTETTKRRVPREKARICTEEYVDTKLCKFCD